MVFLPVVDFFAVVLVVAFVVGLVADFVVVLVVGLVADLVVVFVVLVVALVVGFTTVLTVSVLPVVFFAPVVFLVVFG